mmetsp:Transcript_11546/g.46499  ORF Transcript_11546/g.46499 Transcript_11546/m.46499 type:complete len:275 (-) Transcript_11546:845-1669(-)
MNALVAGTTSGTSCPRGRARFSLPCKGSFSLDFRSCHSHVISRGFFKQLSGAGEERLPGHGAADQRPILTRFPSRAAVKRPPVVEDEHLPGLHVNLHLVLCVVQHSHPLGVRCVPLGEHVKGKLERGSEHLVVLNTHDVPRIVELDDGLALVHAERRVERLGGVLSRRDKISGLVGAVRGEHLERLRVGGADVLGDFEPVDQGVTPGSLLIVHDQDQSGCATPRGNRLVRVVVQSLFRVVRDGTRVRFFDNLPVALIPARVLLHAAEYVVDERV